MRSPHYAILHYLDGRLARGRARFFFHVQDTMTFLPESGAPEEVPLADLKAVFFVGDLRGSGHGPGAGLSLPARTGTGRLVRVLFRDGEVMMGWTREFSHREKGFYMRPLEGVVNNRLVFIPRTAITSVEPI